MKGTEIQIAKVKISDYEEVNQDEQIALMDLIADNEVFNEYLCYASDDKNVMSLSDYVSGVTPDYLEPDESPDVNLPPLADDEMYIGFSTLEEGVLINEDTEDEEEVDLEECSHLLIDKFKITMENGQKEIDEIVAVVIDDEIYQVYFDSTNTKETEFFTVKKDGKIETLNI